MYPLLNLLKILLISVIVIRCGSSDKLMDNIVPRIIGGSETKPNIAPFMVSLQQEPTPGSSNKLGQHFCGGVLLTPNWILSAAHCFPNPNVAKKTIVVAGAHNIQTTEKTTQTRKIDFQLIHELYIGGTAPYDLALIYVKEKFILNKYVNVISLPKKMVTPSGQGTLYGWGSISMTSTPIYPNKLHSVVIPIISRDECKKALGTMGANVHETNLCTGPLTGGSGICQADSGGPLIGKDESGKKDVLIGIVSWGKSPCGQKNAPSIYVQVSYFIDWIAEVQKNGPK